MNRDTVQRASLLAKLFVWSGLAVFCGFVWGLLLLALLVTVR